MLPWLDWVEGCSWRLGIRKLDVAGGLRLELGVPVPEPPLDVGEK
jgi:hypothetical protein